MMCVHTSDTLVWLLLLSELKRNKESLIKSQQQKQQPKYCYICICPWLGVKYILWALKEFFVNGSEK